MSSRRNFLPQHPKIVKRVSEKFDNSLRNSGYSHQNNELDSQVVEHIINKQRQQTKELQKKLQDLTNTNELMEKSLSYHDDEGRKMQIMKLIEKAKAEQEEIMIKISNCEKVGESTTPEEYYLWQKKKKMDEFNKKLGQIQEGNRKQRDDLKQISEKFRQKIIQTKHEIQSILQQIERTENQYKDEEQASDPEEIDPEKINAAQEEYDTLLSTVKILRENNQILSSQLQDSIQSIQLGLKKSFQNSRSSLIRQLQSIKRQVENSEPTSPQDKGKQIGPSQAIDDYVNKLKEIQELLSKQEAEEASKIIKPFDWSSVRWEQYLGPQSQSQSINYLQKFEKMSKDHEQYQKQIKLLQRQFQETLNETVKLNQQNFSVESALIKLSKILQSLNRK